VLCTTFVEGTLLLLLRMDVATIRYRYPEGGWQHCKGLQLTAKKCRQAQRISDLQDVHTCYLLCEFCTIIIDTVSVSQERQNCGNICSL
jgi:hypothetical protein